MIPGGGIKRGENPIITTLIILTIHHYVKGVGEKDILNASATLKHTQKDIFCIIKM